MPAGLEPKSGSVRPKQPIASPAAIRGSHSLLLLLAAVSGRSRTSPASPAPRRSCGARVAGLQLHAGQAVADGAGAGAAVALEVHAEHAELAELLRQFSWQGGRFEPVLDIGLQPGVDELADGCGDVAFIGVQQSVGVEQLQRRIAFVASVGSGGGDGGKGHGGLLGCSGSGHRPAKPSRRTSNASRSSSSEMVSGGRNLSTLPNVPAVSINTPLSWQYRIDRCIGVTVGRLIGPETTSSIAIIAPRPRISPTTLGARGDVRAVRGSTDVADASGRAGEQPPRSRWFRTPRARPRRRRGCRCRCHRYRPAWTASMTSARPVTAASGSPPASPLAVVTRSGTIRSCSLANHAPVRRDTGLHLVGDEHDAAIAAEVGDPAQEAVGGDDEAALTLDRFDDDARHRVGAELGVDEVGELPERLVGAVLGARTASGRGTPSVPGTPRGRTGRSRACTAGSWRSSSWSAVSVRGTRGRTRRPPADRWPPGRT